MAGKACSRSRDTWGSAANQLCGPGRSHSLSGSSLHFFENGKLDSVSYPSLGSGILRNSAEAQASSVLREKVPPFPPAQEALADLVLPLGTSFSLFPYPRQHLAAPSEESKPRKALGPAPGLANAYSAFGIL